MTMEYHHADSPNSEFRTQNPETASMLKDCPICHARTVRRRRADKYIPDNTFLVCCECGHGFCSKPAFMESNAEQAEFNQESFFGASETDPIPSWFQSSEQICIQAAAWHLDHFQKYARGNRLLDIGCGLGGFLGYIRSHSTFTCFGNDISEKACALVEKRWGIPTRAGPFSRTLFADVAFDIIFLSHVIEHIPDPHSFVKEIGAVCAPGAIIAVVCPNDASLTASAKRHVFYRTTRLHEFGHLHWPMHLNGFTPRSLDLLFTSEGFTRLSLTTWSKGQKLYGSSVTGRERLLYPLYFAERAVGKGNLIVAYFQAK
jgi:2-polyprenyl-3-methyl-5-hydroxy-6-metoxy-1,4-benzoquinol methylase